MGLRWHLPAELSRITWFGAGPGEAYPDTRNAARIGRFHATVDDLQTPYIQPQENGNRADVRWAELADATGHGLRIQADTPYNLAARRWTDQHLAAATHQPDLVPDPLIYLHTDHAVQGIGTGACGPGVLPRYRLEVAPAHFAFTLSVLESNR